jgi:hypothetical protein
MTSTLRLATIGAAALLSLAAFGANAQTGRPSEAPTAQPAVIDVGGNAPGSYARYLMLNGTPRDVALVQARNIDHPATATTRTAKAKSAPIVVQP